MGIEILKEQVTYFRTVFLTLYGLALASLIAAIQLYLRRSVWAWALLAMGIALLFGAVITIVLYFKACRKLGKYEERQSLRKWQREIKKRRR